MKKILITGSLGQIGSELITYLGKIYGENNIFPTDILPKSDPRASKYQNYHALNVEDGESFATLVKDHKITTIINLAAILSARGETMPEKTWEVNMNGLLNSLKVAKDFNCQVFTPSSIAAFGKETPKDKTPQTTIQRPTTMYGITKVAGELLSDYYFLKFGVDTRSVRFPGIISYKTAPGVGTTDYAVHIYHGAKNDHHYSCYLKADTELDMLYIDDALKAVADLLEADPSKLTARNSYNITALSLTPEIMTESIKKFIPDFTISYDVDPVRQSIADSWPNSLDDSLARADWSWQPTYDLDKMTKEILENI